MAKRLLAFLLLALLALAAGITAQEPAAANPLSGVVAISAGGGTCALTTEAGVKCWGFNYLGELGNGTTTMGGCYCIPTPVDVSGLTSGVAAVSAGGGHACAVTTQGSVKCWGYNQYGQLGDGRACGRVCSTPVEVTGLISGIAAISAGLDHTCAVTTGGGVKCWGLNSNGQLGDGTTTDSSTPVGVTALTGGVIAVSAGGQHTCAITAGRDVKCWGYNSSGQLGDGTTTNSSTPVDITGLMGGVTAVSGGGQHTCALTTGRGVMCWGLNSFGQVGDGTTTDSPVPVEVAGLTDAAAVAASDFHTCAMTAAGGVKCWGTNASGELGNGTTTASSTPVDVSGLTNSASAISAAGAHNCALTADGGVKCWGDNVAGWLGNGTTTDSTTPVDVLSVAKSVCGDVNNDGQVNSIDGQLILQFGAGLTQLSSDASADVNHDALIDSRDALVILQYGAGLVLTLSC